MICGTALSAGAELSPMTDEELAAVSAQGFSSFTVDAVNGIATIELSGIQVSTYTTIERLRMGYWDNGGYGWDQDWESVDLGTGTASYNNLELNGFFMEAHFDNMADPVNRTLTRFRCGFREVEGDLRAEFHSLSATSGDGIEYRANRPGGWLNPETTFDFPGGAGSHLIMEINLTGPNQGIRFDFGNAES